MTDKAVIKEIFTSIQGEGPYIGCKQIFIRFCGCNLHCQYCDTDFGHTNSKEYSIDELVDFINQHTDCHSVSLTGGEPLLHSGFLKEFLPQCPLPVYLETNATLCGELKEVIDYIDYISADIKIPSCSGQNSLWKEHDNFLGAAFHKILFAKIVFDTNITEEEITNCCKLGAKYGIELILQPKMENSRLLVNNDFIEITLNKFLQKYKKVRVIPQVHKFLDIR